MAQQIKKKFSLDLCKLIYEQRKNFIRYDLILPEVRKINPEIKDYDLPVMRERWALQLRILARHEKNKAFLKENPVFDLGPQQVKQLIDNNTLNKKHEESEAAIFERAEGDPSWREEYKKLKYLKNFK